MFSEKEQNNVLTQQQNQTYCTTWAIKYTLNRSHLFPGFLIPGGFGLKTGLFAGDNNKSNYSPVGGNSFPDWSCLISGIYFLPTTTNKNQARTLKIQAWPLNYV
jgi:hypothetical protein